MAMGCYRESRDQNDVPGSLAGVGGSLDGGGLRAGEAGSEVVWMMEDGGEWRPGLRFGGGWVAERVR